MATKPTFANIAAKAVSARPITKPPTPQIQIIAKPASDSSPPEAATAKTPTDDTSTHVSSSESSVKLPSFDKQSVASGTTFAMDEKESLRPDDSASLRAVNEDEDGPSTGPAGSRVGSDTDARAFSDQLHRIQQIGTGPPRAMLQAGQRPQIQFGQMPLPINPAPETETPNAEVNDPPNPISVAPGMPPVDEKLLDGLANPRNRVFILKIEQDILDFMKNDSEAHLTLPDCNSFFRMLSHRLADYYGLDHTHHPRDSGTAVLLSKTPHSRLPPPLAGLSVPGNECNSPPPEIAARKIMRRGEGADGMSGPSTTANSEGPSKATSEVGDGTNGKPKDKSSMTREEREKAYQAARLRILGAAEPDPEEAKKVENENDLSRSSSASGKKKTKKRKDDDDFETRSQFPGYYGNQSYGHPGYGDGSFYFPQYATMMSAPQQQYSMAPTASPPPQAFATGGYMQVDPTSQMQYVSPQQYSTPQNPVTSNQAYPPSGNTTYDFSTQFQQMTLGGQNQQGLPQKPGTSPNFGTTPQMQPAQQGWASSPYENQQQYMYVPQQMYGQYADRTPQAPTTIPYAYGQLPNPALQGGKMQHPLPGSFNRQQQFNPQTQAFVPGGAGRGGPMQMSTQNFPFFGQYTPVNTSSGMQQPYRPSPGSTMAAQHRPSPVKNNSSGAYPSPASMQQPVQAYNVNANITPTMHFQTIAPHNHQQPQIDATSQQVRLNPGSATLAHPLPQPPNPESSIAKWGTPAHLPPKPPTPTNPHPTKFIDINKGIAIGRGAGFPRGFGGAGAS